MVLELKEYTMASLGYKSLENPLISANQTRPSPFYIKTHRTPSSFSLSSSLCLLHPSRPTPPFSLLHPPPGAARMAVEAVTGEAPPVFLILKACICWIFLYIYTHKKDELLWNNLSNSKLKYEGKQGLNSDLVMQERGIKISGSFIITMLIFAWLKCHGIWLTSMFW